MIYLPCKFKSKFKQTVKKNLLNYVYSQEELFNSFYQYMYLNVIFIKPHVFKPDDGQVHRRRSNIKIHGEFNFKQPLTYFSPFFVAVSFTSLSGKSYIFALSQEITNINRSEERRVGKECRSRWSPYH